MIKSYELFWKNAFVFRGRTTRRDFWLAFLAEILVSFLIIAIGAVFVGLLGDAWTPIPFYAFVAYSVANVLPSLSIQVRRLRDAGHSPWLLLLAFVPWVGGLILLFFLLQPSSVKAPELHG